MTAPSFRELRLEGLKRDFGAFNALKGLDLVIRQGEFIALLGPSGCGKTTALNCIAGLLATTGGRIMLDDTRIDLLRPEQRGFGMVFQNYALFPHMSIRRNVGFGLKMRGVARAEIDRRVDAALATVRLTEQGEKLPGQLSGGQQQRVAIARAIVIAPPVVLMDEPLSNLDAKLRLEMRAEIRRIHRSLGSTTIYVTHDQDEALSLADRIVVLREGAIRQVGTPAQLYSSPAYPDVADFMGYRNRMDGTFLRQDGDFTELAFAGGIVRGRAEGAHPGERALAMVRPEDLTPTAAAEGIAAKVEAMEFRGHGFHGIARAEDGSELFFASHHRHEIGAALRLLAEPARVRIFRAELAP